MTQYDPDKHRRRSIRMPGYDYAQAGAYFVTIVTHNRELTFDDPVLHRVAETMWQRIPRHFDTVELDEWIVMPNHIHGILWIINDDDNHDVVGATHSSTDASMKNVADTDERPRTLDDVLGNASPLPGGDNGNTSSQRDGPAGPPSGSLGAIVGNFKSVTGRRINRVRKTPGAPVWQRNYYERIVRNERELNAIRRYIRDNPIHWAEDPENPDNAM